MNIDDIYRKLFYQVRYHGVRKENRTGVDTISTFGAAIRIDLEKDGFPLLTTKKLNWHAIRTELLWFILGSSNIRYLHQHDVHIWDLWADERGEVDAGYGAMWRGFPTYKERTTDSTFMKRDGDVVGYEHKNDQLKWCIEELRHNPNSRRAVVLAWNPSLAQKAKLPPCHYTFCLNVTDGKLNLHWTQRSCDLALGVPFNIASYALLTHIIARELGLQVGVLMGSFLDLHVYTCKPDGSMKEFDHMPKLIEQCGRPNRVIAPTVRIIGNGKWDGLVPSDLEIVDYDPHPAISFKPAV